MRSPPVLAMVAWVNLLVCVKGSFSPHVQRWVQENE